MFETRLETSHGLITVTDSGTSGPVVLMVHGNSSCRHAFSAQFAAPFARRYRMIALDLPGHGASADAADPERSYNIPGYADLTIEVLAMLGVASAAILGWSLGGHVGLEIMARWPALAGLMIVGTPPVTPHRDAIAEAFLPSDLMALAGKQEFTPVEAEAYAAAMCGGVQLRDDRLRQAVYRADGRARRHMMESALSQRGIDGRWVAETSSIPLAVVSGGQEPFINNAYLERIHYNSLWRDEVCIMPEVGHAPFIEAPDRFNVLLRAFLEDLFFPHQKVLESCTKGASACIPIRDSV